MTTRTPLGFLMKFVLEAKGHFLFEKKPTLAFVFWISFFAPLAPSLPASAKVEADLSDHLVPIQANFEGDKILLFGSVTGRGDVVVVVRGPNTNFKLHRKSEVGGIWVNTASMTFKDAPSFYATAATAPLDQIASEHIRALNEIGLDHINFELSANRASGPVAEQIAKQWKSALVKSLQDSNNYQLKRTPIRFLGENLFRTEFELPSSVPTGNYDVSVYHLQYGRIVSALRIPLSVSKVGLEADIYDFSQQEEALYGTLSALAALIAGWVGSLLFRS